MTQLKLNYKRLLLSAIEFIPLQFVIGAFFAIFAVGILIWGFQWEDWLNNISRFNSLVAMSAIYLCSFISIRRFSVYMGQLNLRYVFSVFGLWMVVAFGLLLVFRLSYSVYFLTFSCLTMFVYFGAVAYIKAHYHHRIVGYIPIGRINDLPNLPSILWVALVSPEHFKKVNVDLVMADLRADLSDEWEHFLAECALKHMPVYHSGRLIEMLSGRIKIDHLYENDLGSLLPSKSYQFIKRFLDVCVVLLSLPLTLPLMVTTALLVVLDSRGGIFFLQERIGQGGVPFTVYKFRSMSIDSEKDGSQFAKAHDLRITRVGSLIRKTRIDELPQFWNVLKGEMSLIGPRPEQKKFVDDFDEVIPFYNYRHIVKPGISGWAQVMQGYVADRDNTKIKLEYDFYYIKNFHFSMDLLIFFKTIQTVITGFGAR